MKITVAITCYNEGRKLSRAVKSLNNQTDSDFEILIVNDASPCEITNMLCREYEKYNDVKVYWRKNNGGLAASRNTAFNVMRGDVFVALDADDELPYDAIKLIKKAFIDFPDAGYIFGDYFQVGVENNKRELVDLSPLVDEFGYMDPAKCLVNWKMHGSAPCKKSTWLEVGGYDMEFSYGGQDVDFWMKVFGNGIKGKYVSEILYLWYKSSAGMNARRSKIPENKLDIMRKNIKVFDKYNQGVGVRNRLMRGYFLRGEKKLSRKYARQVLKNHFFNFRAIAILILPHWLLMMRSNCIRKFLIF